MLGPCYLYRAPNNNLTYPLQYLSGIREIVPHHNIATDFRRTLSARSKTVPDHNLTQAFQPLSVIREIVPHRNLARIRPNLGALGECALPVGRDKRGR